MAIRNSDLADNQEVWACAYSTNDSEKSMSLRKEPVYGVIKSCGQSSRSSWRFFEFKKNGEIKKSSGVYLSSRTFTETEEEAIKVYNEYVMKQVKRLDKLKEECMSHLI